MAADLHIHVASFGANPDEWYYRFGVKCPIDYMISKTPNVWIGSVSWYSNVYIPPPVDAIARLFDNGRLFRGGRLKKIDNRLICAVSQAMLLPNHTQFRLEDREKVLKFLGKHKGKLAFVVSW